MMTDQIQTAKCMDTVAIISYTDAVHRSQVVTLWKTVLGYDAPHNQPSVSIDKKIEVNDGLFFVAVAGAAVVGTIMAGYDGHRGGIYSVAVALSHGRQGIGSPRGCAARTALVERGCV